MQTELTQPGPLLDPLGRLAQVGWSRQPLLEANLEAANADALAARAELKRSRILAEEYDVQLARANHQRSTELFEEKLISKSDYDATRGRLDEALNRQRAASAAIGVIEASIEQKRAQVAQIQAVVDRIREELKYTSIRSPLHGIVLSRTVEIGSAARSAAAACCACCTAVPLETYSQPTSAAPITATMISRR